MALLDDLDKTLVRCDVLVMAAGAERTVSLFQMQALRGDDKALDRLVEGLDAAEGVTPPASTSAAATLLPESAGYVDKPPVHMPSDMTPSPLRTKSFARTFVSPGRTRLA